MTLPALCLIPLVALLRVLLGWHVATQPTWLIGCMPLSAVALCAGIFLPRRWSLVVPLGILLISDWIIDLHFGVAFFGGAMLVRYVLLAAIGGGGMYVRLQPGWQRPLPVLLSAAFCATLFYVVSIVFTWAGSPDYAQSLAGLGQALTVGLPGYPPSYYFYRNALVSDLLYSIVFIACMGTSRHGTKRLAPSRPAAANIAGLADV
jgi:hypothetical protein